MLVLTRKVGDVIAIGDNIKIVVMAIKGKQVRLGVQADRNTIVHREEVYQKIQQEIKAAMASNLDSTTTAGDLLRTASATTDEPDTQASASRPQPVRLIRRPAATTESPGTPQNKEAPSAGNSNKSSVKK